MKLLNKALLLGLSCSMLVGCGALGKKKTETTTTVASTELKEYILVEKVEEAETLSGLTALKVEDKDFVVSSIEAKEGLAIKVTYMDSGEKEETKHGQPMLVVEQTKEKVTEEEKAFSEDLTVTFMDKEVIGKVMGEDKDHLTSFTFSVDEVNYLLKVENTEVNVEYFTELAKGIK